MKKAEPKQVSVEELERLLNSEDDAAIEILPDGTIRSAKKRRGKAKVLTLKQTLGGEYAR